MKLPVVAPRASRTMLRRNDDGIALPMVLVVFLVGFALVGAFLVAIVGSAQVSDTTRSGIQAQAAAEAGIQDLVSRANSTPASICGFATVPVVGTAPTYTASVEFWSLVGPGSWVKTCPTASTQMRIKSEGRSADSVRVVEQIRDLTIIPATTAPEFQNLLRTAATWEVQGNTTVLPVNPSFAMTIDITDGDFVCSAGTTFGGSVRVLNGNAELGGACLINGDLLVSGNLSRDNGSARVLGDVNVRGNVSLGGGASPKPIGKNLTYGGTLTLAWGSNTDWVAGTTTRGTVPIPAAPSWVAISKASFVSKSFTSQTWEGGCDMSSSSHPMVAKLAAYTTPTVIEVPSTTCPTLSFGWNGQSLALKTSVAIIAQKINIKEVHFSSASSASQQVFFVSSSSSGACPTVVDKKKVEPEKATLYVNGARMTGGKITGLLYSPCSVAITNYGGTNWVGSVYTKEFIGTPLMTYSPITIGGTVSPPVTPPSGGSMTLGATVKSQRNVE